MRTPDLDPEVLAFIRDTERFYEGAEFTDIADQRRCYDTLCAAFNRPYPDGVSARDETVDSGGRRLPLRRYERAGGETGTAVVYYHGGGYILGGLDSHDSICAEFCSRTGLTVLATDYRLAPEHHFPADLDDATAAFVHATGEFRRVLVAGDSAGGNLAAGVCLRTREQAVRPAGQLLIYPELGGELFDLPSWTEQANPPLMSAEDVRFYLRARSSREADRDDPLFFPLLAKDFTGLPPAAVFSADLDSLRDDGREYVRRLTEDGVPACWRNEPGLPHGYLRARHQSRLAADAFTRICMAFEELAGIRIHADSVFNSP